MLPGADSTYTIIYQLWSEDFNGQRHRVAERQIRFIPLSKMVLLVSHFRLLPAFPNPFNGQVVIRWQNPASVSTQSSYSEIAIYTLTGQLINRLWRGSELPASGQVIWNATDGCGMAVASGMYLVVVRMDSHQWVQKIVLLR
jgi:hypothetical protein